MIKLLIFDLDNTLFDTYNQVGVKAIEMILEKLRKKGLSSSQEKMIRDDYCAVGAGFTTAAKKAGVPDEMIKSGREVYKELDLSKIKPFDDIALIKEFPQKKVLVTIGVVDVQKQKIRALQIAELFDEIIITDSSSGLLDKQNTFVEIMKKSRLKPEQIMVIGDCAEAEIKAGKNLGMVTVQIMRRNIKKGDADYYVKSLREIKEIIANFD